MTKQEKLAHKLADACIAGNGFTLTQEELLSVMNDVLVAMRVQEVLMGIEAKEAEMTSVVRGIPKDTPSVETVAMAQALVGVAEKKNTLRMVLGGIPHETNEKQETDGSKV